jgi:PAS domain S-box-containing protein
VYFKDLDSRFIRVSKVQATKLGFATREEAIGRSDADAFLQAHARKALEDEQRIIASGKPLINIEERETFHDGREAWVSTTKMPLIEPSGAIIGTFGTSRDVTTRKRAEQALRESEERWRTLLANSQEMVMLVDHNGLLAYASPSVERWLGYHPDELIGTVLGLTSHASDELALATHADDQAALAQVFDDVYAGRAGANHSASINHRVKAKDGSWHSLESTVVSLRDDPAINAVLIASRDVTEHVALEEERERLDLERRVSQRLEAVGQLAAGIAHEINTPLQFVGDSVTFLREAVDELQTLTDVYHELLHTQEAIDRDERQRRAVAAEEEADLDYLRERIPSAFTRTVDGIARVTSIVQAMKRFSHPSSSDTTPADLNEAIETTLAVCRNEYKYAAEIVLDLGALPPVLCNIGELNQVFLNLIINAAQAIEEKNAGTEELGTIRIATRLEGDDAIVEIADNGPGIPLELQDRIYEPFFTTKEIGKGSGQGLALARTTIEQHSGALECTSAPGAGTTFTLRLPVKPPANDIAQAA